MSLRWRFALWFAAVTALTALLIGSLAGYALARALWTRTDDSLVNQAASESAAFGREAQRNGGPPGALPAALPGSETLAQIIDPDGRVHTKEGMAAFEVSDAARAVALQGAPAAFSATSIDGREYRVYTTPLPNGGAIQVAIDVSGVQSVLADVRRALLVAGLGVTVVAAVVGVVIARRITRPLETLTGAAEEVARTRTITAPALPTAARRRPDDGRDDEVTRLGRAFDEMLAALAESRAQQERLVQDAGHELRTPLTSLRTNLEVLAQPGALERLDPGELQRLLHDLVTEIDDLSGLVNELIAAARAIEVDDEPTVEVDLADLARETVQRAQQRSTCVFDITADSCPVLGRRGAIERAMGNVVNNADKFSPAGSTIAVTVDGAGRFAVRDHGPGIDAADLPHVFERFYRASAARAVTGSGLGLSIVEQVVLSHGGSTFARNADDGGAIVGFTIPPVNVSR